MVPVEALRKESLVGVEQVYRSVRVFLVAGGEDDELIFFGEVF